MRETDNLFDGIDISFLNNIPAIGADVEIIQPPTKAEKEQKEKDSKKITPIKAEDLDEFKEPKEVESILDLQKEVNSEDEEGTEEGEEGKESEPIEEPVTKIWADWAAEKGLIEFKPEEFEDSDSFLVKKFEEQVDRKFSEWQASLPEQMQELISNYKEGVPLNRLIELDSAIAEYSAIKPDDLDSDEKLQKSVVAAFLNRDGEYTAKELDEEIKELEDTGTLLARAKRALPKLLDFEVKAKEFEVGEAKRATVDAKNRYDSWTKEFRKYLDNKDELIPGYKLDEKARKTIHDSITKVVARDSQGRPLNAIAKRRIDDPDFDAKVAYLAEVLNFDLSAAERKGASKATQALKTGAKPGAEKSGLHAVDISIVRKALKRMK